MGGWEGVLDCLLQMVQASVRSVARQQDELNCQPDQGGGAKNAQGKNLEGGSMLYVLYVHSCYFGHVTTFDVVRWATQT